MTIGIDALVQERLEVKLACFQGFQIIFFLDATFECLHFFSEIFLFVEQIGVFIFERSDFFFDMCSKEVLECRVFGQLVEIYFRIFFAKADKTGQAVCLKH